MKPNVIFIVGPTASGKSNLGVKLARQFNGEIISADSRQIYKGFDLSSGKITKKEMCGVPHHLLDVASPKRTYAVAQYQTAAHRAIADILSRGKLPIVVGGTGLYIRSIIDDISLPNVPPNPNLRKKLEKLIPEQLFSRLMTIDRARAKSIDQGNKRRLIRAIEIAEALGRVPKLKKKERYDTLEIGIDVSSPKLKEKIRERLLARLKKGMIAEISSLRTEGLSNKRLESLGLEYRYVGRFLQKLISRSEMIDQLSQAIYQYAKRQYTWFKPDKRIKWISDPEEAYSLVRNFLKMP